jgi:hypothetical protein
VAAELRDARRAARSDVSVTDLVAHSRMHERWKGVLQVEHEWIAVVRERELKQMEQSYVPFVSSAVSRARRVCEAGAGAGAVVAAGGGAKGVAEAAREVELVERAALNRARRDVFPRSVDRESVLP